MPSFWAGCRLFGQALIALFLISILVISVIHWDKSVFGRVIASAEGRHSVDTKIVGIADPSQHVETLGPRSDYLPSDVEGLSGAIVQGFHASEQVVGRRSRPERFFLLRSLFSLVRPLHGKAWRDLDLGDRKSVV